MNIQKAILVIDAVSNGINDKTIDTIFIDRIIYGKFDRELYNHILNEWKNSKGDFFQFYMSTKDEVKRWILEDLGVEVEPDKYPDYNTRIMAIIAEGKERSDVYPFETEILRQYFLFGYNNSLQVLENIAPSGWNSVTEHKIDPYGSCENWTLYWSVATQADKELLLKHIVELA